jgi:very-short-patch-repair endonuclease
VFTSIQTLFFIIGCLASSVLLLMLLQHLFWKRQQFYKKPLITAFEQKMFIRLNEALPEHHILAQVAFSALITSNHFKIRQQFNRKVTDFVVLNREMRVIAIVELDDPSHIGKEDEDQQRDAMLTEAGYTVFRYTSIPSARELRKDLL